MLCGGYIGYIRYNLTRPPLLANFYALNSMLTKKQLKSRTQNLPISTYRMIQIYIPLTHPASTDYKNAQKFFVGSASFAPYCASKLIIISRMSVIEIIRTDKCNRNNTS